MCLYLVLIVRRFHCTLTGFLYSHLPDWSSTDFFDYCLHVAGTVYLCIDFFVSGLPFRLLHFYQPLVITIAYQVVLVIFTSVTYTYQPYVYFIASYGQSSDSVIN